MYFSIIEHSQWEAQPLGKCLPYRVRTTTLLFAWSAEPIYFNDYPLDRVDYRLARSFLPFLTSPID